MATKVVADEGGDDKAPLSPEAKRSSLPLPTTHASNEGEGEGAGADASSGATDAVSFKESDADLVIDTSTGSILQGGDDGDFDLSRADANTEVGENAKMDDDNDNDVRGVEGKGEEEEGEENDAEEEDEGEALDFNGDFSQYGFRTTPNADMSGGSIFGHPLFGMGGGHDPQADELRLVEKVQDTLESIRRRTAISMPEATSADGENETPAATETMTTLIDRMDTLIAILNDEVQPSVTVASGARNDDQEADDTDDANENNAALPSALQLVVECLPMLRGILDEDPSMRLLPAAVPSPAGGDEGLGADIEEAYEMGPSLPSGKPRCGLLRTKVASTITAIAGLGYGQIEIAILQEGFIPRLIDMLFQFELNSVLHHSVGSLLNICIESQSQGLHRAVLVEASLLERIIQSFSESERDIAEGKRGKGYIGILTSLAGRIQEAADNGKEAVVEAIAGCDRWASFFEETILPIHELYQKPLGGPLPQVPVMGEHADLWDQVASIFRNASSNTGGGGSGGSLMEVDIAQLLAAAASGNSDALFGGISSSFNELDEDDEDEEDEEDEEDDGIDEDFDSGSAFRIETIEEERETGQETTGAEKQADASKTKVGAGETLSEGENGKK
eukprot:g4371.t1